MITQWLKLAEDPTLIQPFTGYKRISSIEANKQAAAGVGAAQGYYRKITSLPEVGRWGKGPFFHFHALEHQFVAKYDWDEGKNKSNKSKHKLPFELAKEIFTDKDRIQLVARKCIGSEILQSPFMKL